MAAPQRSLVMAQSRQGRDIALTTEECVLLAAVRSGPTPLPAEMFPLVENALERLGRLSLITNSIGAAQRDRRL